MTGSPSVIPLRKRDQQDLPHFSLSFILHTGIGRKPLLVIIRNNDIVKIYTIRETQRQILK